MSTATALSTVVIPSYLASVARPPRPCVRGKFFFVGDEKFYVRGVTYGAFEPDSNGREYRDFNKIQADFAQMAANGVNAVRIPHTMPPVELLDLAMQHGLKVMVGLSAEQYIGYLIDRKKVPAPDIEKLVRERVREVAGHPAILCYALGNEIPAPLVRWLGARGVERYLKRLYRAVKAEDPEAVVTYVNYPTTEYLDLSFLDVLSFNVYLETQDRLEAYLARIQNIADDRPLLMSELGLDSLRHGEQTQAEVLEWQLRTAFAAGCAGSFVFAWTDEWFRAGSYVADWDFGLTDRYRNPKPALKVLRDTYAEVPYDAAGPWPRISVVICTYNGNRTISDAFRALQQVEYPNFEVIVVDDGSTEPVTATAEDYGYRLIRTKNKGLSNARNIGWQAATGDIVAYLDDDAYPDPHWLSYLAAAFRGSNHVAIGGPNIPPPGDGWIADCIANAPGGPVHVLLSDQKAEHIPGCNMAFRKSALEAINGFDAQFRTAGDDVDICWQLQQRGWTIGFHPSAVVWHHRRNSVRTYWKQQRGYGRAEALLERKWPEKYNSAGHVTWAGRVYAKGLMRALGAGRIYHGVWGQAPFQSLYQPAPGLLASLPMMPEWYLILSLLGFLTALGVLWRPLLAAAPLLLLAAAASVMQAVRGAAGAHFAEPHPSLAGRLGLRALTAGLYLLQPLARLWGRLHHGLSPLRLRWAPRPCLPQRRTFSHWTGDFQAPEQRLGTIEAALREQGTAVQRGGEFDSWDLEIRIGFLGGARLLMAAEDHGGGAQYVRFRVWPHLRLFGIIAIVTFGLLSAAAALGGASGPGAVLGIAAIVLACRTFQECGAGVGWFLAAMNSGRKPDE
jgi:GT2 family glycosyltransferase